MNQSHSLPTSSENHSVIGETCQSSQAYRQMEAMVEERPFSSVMISFGVGMGVGLAIGATLVASMQEQPKARMAERMGHQFMDALNRVIPDSVANRFSS